MCEAGMGLFLMRNNEELRQVTQEVRNLHASMKHIYGKVACKECGQKYPCNTIRVLNGEQNG